MSDGERSGESEASSRALDEVVSEAKDHEDDAIANIDWARVEARVMAAVEEEKPALVRDVDRARVRSRAFRGAALVLAAAAAVALFVRKDRGSTPPAPHESAVERASASSLRSTEGAGVVRVGGVVATPGYVLHAGDSIDADGARAVFERSGKVTWLLEQDAPVEDAQEKTPVARTRVKSAGESLVLGLESGVIEAQVVPVPAGEAFAVDIATERGVVRVAVHGTHLRVARAGNRVVVDLTEGVVSIGVPPRTGVTYGTLVTAPAHVELDATDLATLRVEHAPESVRGAVPLDTHAASVGASRPATLPDQPSPQPVAVAKPQHAGPGAVARPPDVKETAPATKIEPPRAIVPPRDAIMNGVRECATTTKSRSGDGVRITVSSSLELRVSPAGTVEQARFSPPLLPEIQTCAAEVIYKTKLGETGLVTIPIEFSY